MVNRVVISFVLVHLSLFAMSIASAQTVGVSDTVYTPPGYTDGSGLARVFLPTFGNGIGVVAVHGSDGNRATPTIWCDTLAAYGYTVMSIEYPDPGVNSGPTFPMQSRAVKLAVEFLRRNAPRFGITTGKIVGWGMSQGAITWGEAIIWDNDDAYFQTDSTIDDRLDAAVLLYGYYHYFPGDSNWVKYYFSNDSSRLNKGTCIKHVQNITTPILLLHGMGDIVCPYGQSSELYDSLVALGKVVQLQTFGGPHVFDLNFNETPPGFTSDGLIAKDTALAFLRRIVTPALKIRIKAPTTDFGNVAAFSNDTLQLGIDNIGSSNLTIASVSNTSPGYTLIDLPSLPVSIPAMGSIYFRVSFHPTSHGVLQDTVTIVSDDPLHPKADIAFRGKGIGNVVRAQAGVTYVTSAGQPVGMFHTMNTGTGGLTAVGPLGVPEIQGLAIRPSTMELYGISTSATSTDLFRISVDSGYAVHARTIPIGNLHGLAFSRTDTLYVVTTSGDLFRIDFGTGITNVVGTAPGLKYSSLAFNPVSGKLWASVRTPIDSIYILDQSTGIPTFIGTTGFNAVTLSIAFDHSGTLYALIDNGSGEDYLATLDTINATGTLVTTDPLAIHNLSSMMMRSDSVLTSDRNKNEARMPASYSLSQNYPNPFNPATKISFSLPVAGFTTLKVYDVLGREVMTLVNTMLSAGSHEVIFPRFFGQRIKIETVVVQNQTVIYNSAQSACADGCKTLRCIQRCCLPLLPWFHTDEDILIQF